jgi:predicted ABC-type ATPase
MPKVIVMRGLPGSGKSTTVKTIKFFQEKELGQDVFVVSADNYFMTEDGYRFDASKLGEAHAACMREFIRVLEAHHDNDFTLIVDNTNISAVEIAPYMLVASAFGVKAEVWTIEVQTVDLATCVQRNVHGVSEDTIFRMDNAMRNEKLPPYWVKNVMPMSKGELGTIHND